MILNAKWVRREVMFGIAERANKLFSEYKSDAEIMIQGVIDCVIETDDGLCVIDYKTDKVFSEEEMAQKYRVQLSCYQVAAERIFKKKVTKKILYLFDMDKGIEL